MLLPELPMNTPLAPRSRCRVVISWLRVCAAELASTVACMSLWVLKLLEMKRVESIRNPLKGNIRINNNL